MKCAEDRTTKVKPVKDLMFSDKGVVYQGTEGMIAIDVLLNAAKAKMPAINVFDCFYCRASDKDAFEALFRDSLARLGLGQLTYKIK